MNLPRQRDALVEQLRQAVRSGDHDTVQAVLQRIESATNHLAHQPRYAHVYGDGRYEGSCSGSDNGAAA